MEEVKIKQLAGYKMYKKQLLSYRENSTEITIFTLEFILTINSLYVT